MWKNEYNTTISDVKSTIPPEDQQQTKFSMFVNLSWWKKLFIGWMKFNSRDMKFTLKFLCQKKEEEHKINMWI